MITGTPDSPTFHPISSIASALHRSDLLVLSASPSTGSTVRPLPVSPYPAHPGTAIRAHFVVDKKPDEDGWRPWVGGTWSKWVKGTVVEYKDFAGREAQVCIVCPFIPLFCNVLMLDLVAWNVRLALAPIVPTSAHPRVQRWTYRRRRERGGHWYHVRYQDGQPRRRHARLGCPV